MDCNSKISTLVTTEFDHLQEALKHRNVSVSDLTADLNALLCLYAPTRNYIYEGMYFIHLHNWLCNFPAEKIQILSTDEFQRNSKRIFSQVLDFVGLKPLNDKVLNTITQIKYNYGGKVKDGLDYRLLNLSDRKKLQAIYKPLNEKLLDLLKWDQVMWSD